MHVPRLPRLRAGLLAAALSTCLSGPAFAVGALIEQPFPPIPTPAEYGAAALALGNPLNQPVTGALDRPAVVGGQRPPSLEALQAARPGGGIDTGLEPGRAEALRASGLQYGAQGGLAARAYAINEMLHRYEGQLDTTYDFRSLVLPVGSGGQTLLSPPVVTASQLAFALGSGGQVARETSCIYAVTRAADSDSSPSTSTSRR